MKVDVKTICSKRLERSWSQEELAIAAGLSLRTIQRIEREASASLQSKKAIASALEVDLEELNYEETSMIRELIGKKVSIWLGAINWTESLDGEVVEINETWLKLKTKRKTEYVKIDAISKIAN